MYQCRHNLLHPMSYPYIKINHLNEKQGLYLMIFFNAETYEAAGSHCL